MTLVTLHKWCSIMAVTDGSTENTDFTGAAGFSLGDAVVVGRCPAICSRLSDIIVYKGG